MSPTNKETYGKGYYLAKNILSGVDDVIWIDGEVVNCMSAGDVLIKSNIEDWTDIVGPITRKNFG